MTVGAGATGSTGAGGTGGNSWFSTSGTILAQGGAGGALASANSSNGAGGAGSSGSSVGDQVYRGGNGSNGNFTSNVAGGAGGGGAGSAGVGGDASAGARGTGTSVGGGDGADGVTNNSDGTNGSPYGGGGSGGKARNNTDRSGGSGAGGAVAIHYLPTFTMQYYSDSGLTTPLASNARLKAGTYYVKITASRVLDAAPTVSIAAEGTANDIVNGATTLVSGTDYKYTRVITSDAAAVGSVLEDWSVTGVASGLTYANQSPTNEATKAAYTDTVAPIISATLPSTGSTIDNITSASDVQFTTSETLGSGSLVMTRTGGTADPSSPHTCTFVGTALVAGAHAAFDLSNTTNSCSVAQSLVNGTVYTFTWNATDLAGNAATVIMATGVTYSTVGPPDATQSTLTPTSASITANGVSTQVLTVQAKDSGGTTLTTGGSTVTITRQSGTGTVGAVTDNGNGTYTATVTSPTATGSGVFVATLGGQPVKSGTGSQTQATVTYVPGPLHHFAVTNTSGGAIGTQTEGIAFSIKIVAQDANNNTVTSFISTVALSNLLGGISPTTSGSFTAGVLASQSVTLTAAGTDSITVTASGKTGTSNTFTVNYPTPTTTSLAPNTITAGASGFTLTVYGTNFVPGAVALFNGSTRTTNFVSATELQVSLLTSDLTTAGSYLVTVQNPSPVAAGSNAQIFTVHNLVPNITSLSPNSSSIGGSAFTLSLTGVNFLPTSVVYIGTTPLTTTYVSGTGLTALVPASLLLSAGTFSITVFNPSTGETSSPQPFTVGPLGRYEFNYSRTFYGSASLRKQ